MDFLAATEVGKFPRHRAEKCREECSFSIAMTNRLFFFKIDSWTIPSFFPALSFFVSHVEDNAAGTEDDSTVLADELGVAPPAERRFSMGHCSLTTYPLMDNSEIDMKL